MITMGDALDRQSLAAKVRVWSDIQRRIALERVVEQLPEAMLATLLDGLVRLEEHRTRSEPRTLDARIAAHVAATLRGEFRGELDFGNRHGQREPWQTATWLATTGHLFDLALQRADSIDGLRALVALVEEVDGRADELIAFEEMGAGEHFGFDVERAARLISARPGMR